MLTLGTTTPPATFPHCPPTFPLLVHLPPISLLPFPIVSTMGTLRVCSALLAVAVALFSASPPLGAAGQLIAVTPPPEASELAFTRVCFPVAELQPRAAQVAAGMRAAGLSAAAASRFETDVTSGLLNQPWLRDDSDDEGDDSDGDDDTNNAPDGGGSDDEGAPRPRVEGVATSELLLADPSQPGVLCWKQEVTAEFIIERYVAAGGSTIDDDGSDDDDGDAVDGDDRMFVAGLRGGAGATTITTNAATAISAATAASVAVPRTEAQTGHAASGAPSEVKTASGTAAIKKTSRHGERLGSPPETLSSSARLDLTGVTSRRVCSSCCNLSSFESQFRLLRRCACRLCGCRFDCR